jgi:hypothetical protein
MNYHSAVFPPRLCPMLISFFASTSGDSCTHAHHTAVAALAEARDVKSRDTM